MHLRPVLGCFALGIQNIGFVLISIMLPYILQLPWRKFGTVPVPIQWEGSTSVRYQFFKDIREYNFQPDSMGNGEKGGQNGQQKIK